MKRPKHQRKKRKASAGDGMMDIPGLRGVRGVMATITPAGIAFQPSGNFYPWKDGPMERDKGKEAAQLVGRKIAHAEHTDADGGYWTITLDTGVEFSFRMMAEIVDDDRRAALQKEFVDQTKGTRPRDWPEGRRGPLDDGSLVVAVETEPGLVKIVFPKPVAWFGFPPDAALQLAQFLIRQAAVAATGRPLPTDAPNVGIDPDEITDGG